MDVNIPAISPHNVFKYSLDYQYSRPSYAGNTSLHNLSIAHFREFGENAIASIICFTTKNSQYSDLYKYLCLNR